MKSHRDAPYDAIRNPNLADVLREAIRKSGRSANELSKATGVDQTLISRFLRGYSMQLDTAGPLAAHLGLRLQRVDDEKKPSGVKHKNDERVKSGRSPDTSNPARTL